MAGQRRRCSRYQTGSASKYFRNSRSAAAPAAIAVCSDLNRPSRTLTSKGRLSRTISHSHRPGATSLVMTRYECLLGTVMVWTFGECGLIAVQSLLRQSDHSPLSSRPSRPRELRLSLRTPVAPRGLGPYPGALQAPDRQCALRGRRIALDAVDSLPALWTDSSRVPRHCPLARKPALTEWNHSDRKTAIQEQVSKNAVLAAITDRNCRKTIPIIHRLQHSMTDRNQRPGAVPRPQ